MEPQKIKPHNKLKKTPIFSLPEKIKTFFPIKRVNSVNINLNSSIIKSKKTLREKLQKSNISYPFIIFITSRIPLFLLPVLFIGLAPVKADISFLDVFSRWDGWAYISVAKKGYEWFGPTSSSNIVYYPLFPLLGKILSFFIQNEQLSLWIVSNLSFLTSLIFLYKLTNLEFGESIAQRTLLLLAIFPFSFLFSLVYTESLFMALCIGGIYFSRTKHYFIASLLTALAALTRPTGFIIELIVLMMFFKDGVFKKTKSLIFLFIFALGLFAYPAFQWVKTGTPFAASLIEKNVGNMRAIAPWDLFIGMFNILKSLNRVEYIFSLTLITLILIVVFFAVGIYAFKKLPYYLSVYYTLFYLAAIGMTWNYTTWLPGASTPRFLAIIFPFFITLALLSERRWVYSLYIFMASILYAPLALAFFLGMWVF